MARYATTPSQTVGPYLHIGLPWPDGPFAVAEGTPEGVWIRGVLYDGAGAPVPDGLIETWQADPEGRFDHPDDPRGAVARPGFRAFGRCPTDANGEYGIFTLKPGPVPGPGGTLQAPHIDVSVFARGMLHRTVTRVYFPEEAAANAADPVLSSVPEPERATLVARPAEDGYRFDIRLQGEDETVFFDV
ncbi:protocatechuate 3,4-dioxygenase subunit alpha [Streptomonospora sp. S1-112]|uniref:Protocatechuate 3,4-dioxygenase subunit alpha n=1 Tax=Streptomonospora mangrovi TaxID=2883123 RepID=A0A9X3NU11_9ACTN|nr:protocatechuate 3,4-dioxygenase subunit alpha [Streptomonospora mangrovi]MDA0564081.1 protocatechuate 3,4-dioxygenase subunit alpha [Streptomonospora mangrovi]